MVGDPLHSWGRERMTPRGKRAVPTLSAIEPQLAASRGLLGLPERSVVMRSWISLAIAFVSSAGLVGCGGGRDGGDLVGSSRSALSNLTLQDIDSARVT